MNSDEFREFGKAAIDFVADYLDNIRERDVLPSVTPGYLQELLPNVAPEKSEDWKTIMTDLNQIIMPGVTHWQSPNFHAYYPTQTSFPSIIGDMLTAGLGVVGFSWICSPACTELETVVMDWLAKMLGLPEIFLHSDEGKGGGVIQGSASEAILVAVLAAREQAVKHYKTLYPEMLEHEIRGNLIAYSSDQSNSAIEKSSLLAAVPVRLLEADTDCCLTGEIFQRAVEEDIIAGKFPIICIATLGTTGTCAYDKIEELGPICEKYNIWLHVDAAYAGGALVCPEYRHLLNGIEYVESFNFNLHKWMFTNFDCTAMWLRNANLVVDSFNVDRIYLKHKYQGTTKIPDYRHWQLPLGRKFRALKVWIVLRSYGIEQIQTMIRTHVDLARKFASYVENDDNFEIAIKPSMGLVVFRHKGDNEFTKELLEKITEKKQIYMIPATVKTKYVIRFVVAGREPLESDINYAWDCIKTEAELLRCNKRSIPEKTINDEIKKINDRFSSDLSISMENEKVQ